MQTLVFMSRGLERLSFLWIRLEKLASLYYPPLANASAIKDIEISRRSDALRPSMVFLMAVAYSLHSMSVLGIGVAFSHLFGRSGRPVKIPIVRECFVFDIRWPRA